MVHRWALQNPFYPLHLELAIFDGFEASKEALPQQFCPDQAVVCRQRNNILSSFECLLVTLLWLEYLDGPIVSQVQRDMGWTGSGNLSPSSSLAAHLRQNEPNSWGEKSASLVTTSLASCKNFYGNTIHNALIQWGVFCLFFSLSSSPSTALPPPIPWSS